MLNTRLNDSCSSCPWCPGMLRWVCGKPPGEGACAGFAVGGSELGSDESGGPLQASLRTGILSPPQAAGSQGYF